MSEARTFIESIGRRRAMERLSISDQAMTNAIKRGLPAKYYAGLKELADEVGKECPPHLFGMAGFDDGFPGDAA